MEEHVYAVPAFDAGGTPLQQPEEGRRRDSESLRPRRSETSVFAPNAEFTMTTPLADHAATTLHAAPAFNDTAAATPVYEIPLTELGAPAPVYELPLDAAPPPSWDSMEKTVVSALPAPSAPVYDVSALVLPLPTDLSTAPPPAAAYRVPAFDPPAADFAFDVDEPVVVASEASGDLLAALREVLFRS